MSTGLSSHGPIFLPVSCCLGYFGHSHQKANDDHSGGDDHPTPRPLLPLSCPASCSSVLLAPIPSTVEVKHGLLCALGSWSFKIWLWSFLALPQAAHSPLGSFCPLLALFFLHLPSLGLAAFLECSRVFLGGQSHILSIPSSSVQQKSRRLGGRASPLWGQ